MWRTRVLERLGDRAPWVWRPVEGIPEWFIIAWAPTAFEVEG
jgi:hypothetical protein